MQTFVILASLFGMLAVGTGAFGAHALDSHLDERMLEIWETAVRFQMYHALALMAAAWLVEQTSGAAPAVFAAWAFVFGILVFSGSLYLLALTDTGWLGAITPIGGTAFIAAWAAMAWAGYQHLG